MGYDESAKEIVVNASRTEALFLMRCWYDNSDIGPLALGLAIAQLKSVDLSKEFLKEKANVDASWHQESIDLSKGFLEKYETIYEFDRNSIGFPPLPTNGTVRVETVYRETWSMEYPPPNYDVIFNFDDDPVGYRRTARSVALKQSGTNYQWVHEQMTFYGPKTYTTIDGTFNEHVVITCEKEQVAYHGTVLQGTAVSYSGNDPRLSGGGLHTYNLTIPQVAPILLSWGYRYDVTNAQPSPGAHPNQTKDGPSGSAQE
jgi:hypothetical protein